jgi:hypothetical protein
MCLWLPRPVLLRLSAPACRCSATRAALGADRCMWRSVPPRALPPRAWGCGFRSGARRGAPFAPRAKFWSRERLPYDEESGDAWGKDSDVEDDYRRAHLVCSLIQSCAPRTAGIVRLIGRRAAQPPAGEAV